MSRALSLIPALLLFAGPALAAPPPTVRVTVQQSGMLVLSKAELQRLGVKAPKGGGLLCVEFPAPKKVTRKIDHGGHAHEIVLTPPKVFTGLASGGMLKVARGDAETATGRVPGKPGTAYVARRKKAGWIVLTLAK